MTLDPRSQVLAIDPGIEGAWAVLGFRGEFVATGDIPRFDKLINGVEFSKIVGSYAPEHVAIEKVNAMPKQGVASTFTFACAYGVCIGVSCGIGAPISYILPTKWKRHFKLPGKNKDKSRELAIRLFPDAIEFLKLKKNHGRADALLLARYFLDLKTQGDYV